MNIAVFTHEITTRIGGGYRHSDGYEYRYRYETEVIVYANSKQIPLDILLLIFPFVNEQKRVSEYQSSYETDSDYVTFSQEYTDRLVNIINSEILKNSGLNLPIEFCMKYFSCIFIKGERINLPNTEYINVNSFYSNIYLAFLKQDKIIREELDALYYIRLLNNTTFYFDLNKKTAFFEGQFPLDFAYSKNSLELIKSLLYKGAVKCQDFSCIYKILQCNDKDLKKKISEDIIKCNARLVISCLRRAILTKDSYLVTLLSPKVKNINSIFFYNSSLDNYLFSEDDYKNIDKIIEISEESLRGTSFTCNGLPISIHKEIAIKRGEIFTFMSLACISDSNEIINILVNCGATKDCFIGGYRYEELKRKHNE